MKNLFEILIVMSVLTASASAQSNKIVFGPLEGDDAGVLTVRNGEAIGIELWVRTDPDNPAPLIGVCHGLLSEDIIIAERNGMDPEPEYDIPYWEAFWIEGPFVHDPNDNYPLPEGWTCEMQNALCAYNPLCGGVDTQGEWDLYGTWLMVTNTEIPTEQTYYPLAEGWYPHSGQGSYWAWGAWPEGTFPEQSYCGLYFEPDTCIYIPGDVNRNGAPLELTDVLAMIGFYRGTMEPYLCECGEDPIIHDFAATADPNGNCIPNELNDVVTEIGAYRGSMTASGCPDCPGTEGLLSK